MLMDDAKLRLFYANWHDLSSPEAFTEIADKTGPSWAQGGDLAGKVIARLLKENEFSFAVLGRAIYLPNMLTFGREKILRSLISEKININIKIQIGRNKPRCGSFPHSPSLR
jgi:hypothetical protein